ncbi:MAG: diaminopimelate epimerase [Verrucomicrobiaceae bacterium]|nr:diaminopimelate epimerase [Verrucomicrobiaceae bacterium]
MIFSKYQALGNSYLVLPVDRLGMPPSESEISRLCDRYFGVGSDGVLLGPLPSAVATYKLRIFNPDGSEAEKSGNGLRIFCRYLWDQGLVGDQLFSIETLGGVVAAQVLDSGLRVQIEMGNVSFLSTDIPITGTLREVINETIAVDGAEFQFCGATVGNPHCVIPVAQASEEMARRYGPLLECHSLFPNRTNVQFLQIIDRNNIRIEIWERGAGYTYASGSSSCAAAAVAYRLGLCDQHIAVHMRGGIIHIALDKLFNAAMTGPVIKVCDGAVVPECFS